MIGDPIGSAIAEDAGVPLDGIAGEFNLYRNAGLPLNGNVGTAFNWSGTAASANITLLYASRIGRRLKFAHWALAWDPNALGGLATEVRLLWFPMAGGPETEIALASAATVGPTSHGGVYITDELNALLDAGADVFIGQKTRGDGTYGCKIYSSVIHCVWAV